jgi:hypothetical protein
VRAVMQGLERSAVNNLLTMARIVFSCSKVKQNCLIRDLAYYSVSNDNQAAVVDAWAHSKT